MRSGELNKASPWSVPTDISPLRSRVTHNTLSLGKPPCRTMLLSCLYESSLGSSGVPFVLYTTMPLRSVLNAQTFRERSQLSHPNSFSPPSNEPIEKDLQLPFAVRSEERR